MEKSNYTIPNTDAAKNVAKTEINIINVPNAVQSIVSLQNITTLK